MPQVIFNKIKLLTIHISIITVIFLFLIALLDNKNTMILTIHTDSSQPVASEFYYTSVGVPFSDSKVSRHYKIKNNQYYFRLPNLNEINYARLDPAKRKRNISIKSDIQIIISQWFTTSVYIADIRKSEIGEQIDDYIVDSNGIQFKTTGNDAYLNINLTRKLQHASRNLHIDTFLFALLIYAVLFYIYTLYKTEEFTGFLSSKLILYSLFLALAVFKVDYYKEHVHFNHPPDTIAHLSYIESLHNNYEIFPKFENMYMITNKNAGNYLGHPPLYYSLMNIVYDKNYSVVGNMENFRTLNTIIFLAAILLLFYLSFNTNIALISHFTYLSVLAAIPMHAYLGSSLSNDNLAILGGIIFIVGLQKLLQEKYSNSTYLIIGLGIFIAYFSKLTAALLIFFAGIFFLMYLFINRVSFKINREQIGILLLFILPVLVYQSYILMHYHTLIPTLNATHPQEYLHSVFFIPEAQRAYLSSLEWLNNYWSSIHSGWFGIHSHHSFVKLSIFDYIGLLVLHIFAIMALFIKCQDEKKSYCVLGKLSLLALFSVMAVQVTFSYTAHLHSGYTGGLQVRYLLPFMLAFAIMASIFVDRFRKIFFFNILVIVLCIQALYSDFFYFLKYYI